MAQQEDIAYATLNEVFDSRLESPNLERCVHQFIRAHNWLVVIAPALDQWATIGFLRFEEFRVFFTFVVLRQIVKCNVDLVHCSFGQSIFRQIETLRKRR